MKHFWQILVGASGGSWSKSMPCDCKMIFLTFHFGRVLTLPRTWLQILQVSMAKLLLTWSRYTQAHMCQMCQTKEWRYSSAEAKPNDEACRPLRRDLQSCICAAFHFLCSFVDFMVTWPYGGSTNSWQIWANQMFTMFFFDKNTHILSDKMNVSIDTHNVHPLRLKSDRQRITKKAYLDTVEVFLCIHPLYTSFIQPI